jgi:hypothetical protein
MTRPTAKPLLTIKIDAALAAEYAKGYLRAFGTAEEAKKSLEEFIAGFVEDRLCEEIAFVEEEVSTNSQ